MDLNKRTTYIFWENKQKQNIIYLLSAGFAITLHALFTTAADILIFFFWENQAWNFMWINSYCLVDDSHEMSCLILSLDHWEWLIIITIIPIILVSRQITVKHWRNLAIPNQISLMYQVWLKSQYLHKLSSGNQNMGMSRADNSKFAH